MEIGRGSSTTALSPQITEKDQVLLLAKDIVKKFPGVVAVNHVTYDLKAGEIHGLLGQNGAGKSTLLKVLYGIHRPDHGELYVYGRKVFFKSPRDAREHGIILVHQEVTLMPHLTALENIALLGFMWRKWGARFKKTKFKLYIEDILSKFGIELDLDAKVRDLSVAEKMLVQVATALSMDARILLLDEPTSPMSPKEVERLFDAMKRLKARNLGIAFVTHRVNEALEICDRITVLRNGFKVGTVESRNIDAHELVKMMLGREASEVYMVRDFSDIDKVLARTREEVPLIELRNIVTKPQSPVEVPLKNVSVKVYRGEIVAVFGLVGAGKTELGKTLIGLTKVVSGEIRYMERRVKIKSPADALRLGIMYLPEDRRSEGLIPGFTVVANMDISSLKEYTKWFMVIDRRKEEAAGNDMVKKLNIVTPSLYVKVPKLSGGNQQKVLVARAMLTKARLVIFDEPTIGIDVGAKAEIRRLIYRYSREQGVSVLLLTSEVDEALGLADRIYVMRDGRILGEFINKNLDRDTVLKVLVYGK
ncbi:MAG: D-xylose ABC transporter ATP-binding protein [Thermoprotei archaeon]|nr:MAG: D-xylose ABC transporter ATP-binding protein [Thermoprotei archaeon]